MPLFLIERNFAESFDGFTQANWEKAQAALEAVGSASARTLGLPADAVIEVDTLAPDQQFQLRLAPLP